MSYLYSVLIQTHPLRTMYVTLPRRYTHALSDDLLLELEAVRNGKYGLTFKILRAAVLTQAPLVAYFEEPFKVIN